MMMSWMSGKTEEKNRVSSKKGYLLKLRRSQNLLAPQWGSRWFSIEGKYFKWYRSENDISPSGMINLKFVGSITKMESQGAYTFCVSCPDRNLVLRCTNLQEMNGWMKALHIHADIARGGDGTVVVGESSRETSVRNAQSATPTKKSKLRSSLTLEQEFDLNLKKLDALEKAMYSPDKSEPVETGNYQQKTSKQQNNHKNTNIFRKLDDFDDDGNDTKDVLGRLRSITSESTGSGIKKSMHRNDSSSSVEEISVQVRYHGDSSMHSSNTGSNISNRKKSKEYSESSQTSKQRRRRQRLGIDSGDEDLSDEFDTNSDGGASLPHNRDGKNGGRGGSSSNNRRGSGAAKEKMTAKLSAMSIDSVESETFHYIPEVSQNDPYGSNYSKPQRNTRNNVKSAW